MKTILLSGAVAILTFAIQSFFPWWSVAIIPFAAGLLFAKKGGQAFAIGCIGVFLVWLIHTLLIQYGSTGLMGDKIATLFGLPAPALIVVTATLGGIIGGISGLTGYYLSHTSKKRQW